MYRAAAYYVGVDPCTENPDDARKILDVLVGQKSALAYYSSHIDIGAAAGQIRAGEIAVRNFWSGETERVKKYAPSIEYIFPKEGIDVWNDNLAVPVDAPHPDAARVFIAWMMEPRNAAEASNFTKYNNGITGSEEYMDPYLVQDETVTPPDYVRKRFREAKPCSMAAQQLSDKVWAGLWPREVR